MIDATQSNSAVALERLSRRSAAAVVARARAASTGFNAALLRRLAAAPGAAESLLAEPVFEVARNWTLAATPLGDLAGDLLHPELIAALDRPGEFRWPRERAPRAHQLEAWVATLREGQSCLVTAGTGAGKTECFLIPLLDDLLRNPRRGGGIQAILLYPLNALIESQRERLAAWAEGLGGRVRFALFNGDTPETARQAGAQSTKVELKCRKDIRDRPPEILVTNITMLEYLLLRPADAPIIEASQGALRWLVLDEAHTFAGAQAAEMALMLRRVRAAFGVTPNQVRLVATSATIGGEADASEKLRHFLASLAGQPPESVRVIEGRPADPRLPAMGADATLDPDELPSLDDRALWDRLSAHPRLQSLRRAMGERAVSLSGAARTLFGDSVRDESRDAAAQVVLDCAARATGPDGRLLPWRVHLFHRPLGGIWACIDPTCTGRDPELSEAGSGWGFGAIHPGARERCGCGAPAFEVVLCGACGMAHLAAQQIAGAVPRLEAPLDNEGDDFALDAEPDDGDTGEQAESGAVWLAPARGEAGGPSVTPADARIWDNAPPENTQAIRLRIIERAEERNCCSEADRAPLSPLRYGPAFFMGNGLPLILEALEQADDRPDLPMGGRRALTFSDSRQGVARLAAKLQQDAERTLTRSFLYHAVQEGGGGDPAEIAQIENQLARLRTAPEMFADMIRDHERRLASLTGGAARAVPWSELRRRFSQQLELQQFAGDVWKARLLGASLADDPERLAEMFLFRELFRRPRVQNNPETMGLLRLTFPKLEERARLEAVPPALAASGVDAVGWTGLALATIDFVFRSYLAVDLPNQQLVRLISPRFGVNRGVMAHEAAFAAEGEEWSRRFPGPLPATRPGPMHRMIYALLGGHWDNVADRDRAAEVLDALWRLITATAARDVGRGVWRIDFEQAAVIRLDRAFVCPVTRRLFGYCVAGRSPYQLTPDTRLPDMRPMDQVTLPRLPCVNAGGLDAADRAHVARWCDSNEDVATMRGLGLWTNLHDRVAAYAPFLRAQEHSAQIERPVLKQYVELFEQGRINLLNCSTTMEMGVDIADVRLVVNANVPPAIANYRQRSGRAGRRGEPWAFTLTFARDLPLDRWAAADPVRYLGHPIAAPKVWLDSAPLVQRHVNAALLAAFLRERGGQKIRGSIGAFFGAGETAAEPVLPDAPGEAFLAMLAGKPDVGIAAMLETLTQGTVLADNVARLFGVAAQTFEDLLRHWRNEHRQLLERAEVLNDKEARLSMQLRAARMRGEFLIAELARRGFTPSYGFPTDVVSFDYLSGHRRSADTVLAFGDLRGAASRTLDVALREYAPGAELVIDGLVYRSDGIRPAWGSDTDASHLEDLRDLWHCRICNGFGLARLPPERCPRCDGERIEHGRALIPTGFLSRSSSHTGYEALAHVPFEMPRLAADGAPWIALPDAAAGGRLRCDPEGHVIATGSGAQGQGYAICLACGRSEPEAEADGVTSPPLPDAIRRHAPLLLGKGIARTRDGYCPGGYTQPQRIQRQVRLVHAAQTDVFELQLAATVTPSAGLALAAGLREALAERLGIEAREIGLAAGPSQGVNGEACCSVFLFDRAAGGAGYVTRLAEPEGFEDAVSRAADRLDCPEACVAGCAACVLRPDLNIRSVRLDRCSGHAAAAALRRALVLPEALRVLGADTKPLGRSATDWLLGGHRAGWLRHATVFLHGDPKRWQIGGWSLANLLPRLVDSGIATKVVLAGCLPTSPALGLAERLTLHRLAASGVSLAKIAALPEARGRPVIAIVERAAGMHAIIADPAEAEPGPDWGAGALAAAVVGRWEETAPTLPIDAEALLRDALGGARLMWVGAALDGGLKGFGARFWNLVRGEVPIADQALASGIAGIDYSDRYLLTPLTLALLCEVIGSAPGAKGAQVQIALAPGDRSARVAGAVHDAYVEDAVRRDVLRHLLPAARVTLAGRKTELPHHRHLTFTLRDGRRVTILLDQGFGGWRTEGFVRHDFGKDARAQAHAIANLEVSLRTADPRGTPLTIEVKGIAT